MKELLATIWKVAKESKKWYMFLIASLITAGAIAFYVLMGCQTTNTVSINEGGSQSVTVNAEKTAETGSGNEFPINVKGEESQSEQERALLYQTNAPGGQ